MDSTIFLKISIGFNYFLKLWLRYIPNKVWKAFKYICIIEKHLNMNNCFISKLLQIETYINWSKGNIKIRASVSQNNKDYWGALKRNLIFEYVQSGVYSGYPDCQSVVVEGMLQPCRVTRRGYWPMTKNI